jgi:NitT/TauT family transport system permease protein
VPLAVLVAFSKFLERTLYPSAVTLEMVPKIAFAPLFVTWFGFGFAPKMLIVFMVCFFPILLNGILAFRSLSHELIYFSRSTGAGALTMFWRIRLPAALPQMFVGLKGAATNATVGATRGWATTCRSRSATCGPTWGSASSSCWRCSGSPCSTS